MNNIRLAIFDQHKLVRKGLDMMLNMVDGFHVMIETDSIRQLKAQYIDSPPDILLMELSPPYEKGLKLISTLLKLNRATKIIILMMNGQEEYIAQIVRRGISCYLPKDIEPQELKEAIFRVYEKGKYTCPSISHKLIMNGMIKPEEKLIKISTKEKEVVQLVARGLSDQHIAERLGLCISRVDECKFRVMEKINAKNFLELIIKAIEYKLIC